MKTLILLQGVPGSGKSTLAHELSRAEDIFYPIFSTDHFWLGLSEDGTYAFDGSRLAEAHQWNHARAEAWMAGGGECLIIDNTNIKKAHARPYLDLAKKYGYDVEVVRVECDPQVAFERCTHGVPLEVIQRMAREMEDLL